MNVHKEIFKQFHSLDDSKWADLIFQTVDSQVVNGVKFPGFPQENIQIGMIGSSGKNALYEPKYMYQEIRRIAAKQKLPFNKRTTLLDFACGYGRNIRFFMKDIYPGNLYASDVRTDFIDICRNTFCTETCNKNERGVIFDINTPFPPLNYNEKTFDIIIAYSLFSHFSENAHLAWLKEFLRILKTDGLLFLTIRQQSFLTNLKCISVNQNISEYDKMLYRILGTDAIQERYNNGEYIFNPSGGGHELTNNFYGDTVIPDKYIHTKWVEWFDIIEHYDDPSRLPQAFICLRPKKKINYRIFAKSILSKINQAYRLYRLPDFYLKKNGFCPVCNQKTTFISENIWLRDHFICSKCGCIPRERALMLTIEKYYPDWKNLSIHESSPSEHYISKKFQTECKNYTASQFYQHEELGIFIDGNRNENLEKQSFCDETFDIVITQDVFEHLYNPEKAFSEIARTLKHGGAHIFTVPIINKFNKTEIWAKQGDNGEPVFLKTEEWHHNPIDIKGSPVTMHWGYDIVDFIKKYSGLDTNIEYSYDLHHGIWAEYIEILASIKI